MNCAASVFPGDHYSSPPQTADITHDHLANPWCKPLPDPFPALPAHVQAVSLMPGASLAASSLVLYLQEQHSSGAGLDQMAVISQTEAQRWEAWPILWCAVCSNRCRSQWINVDAQPRCSRSVGVDPATGSFWKMIFLRSRADICNNYLRLGGYVWNVCLPSGWCNNMLTWI